jgi:hypothetical protein
MGVQMQSRNFFVTMRIRCNCNYSCFYCQANRIKEETEYHSPERLRKIYSDLSAFVVTNFECGASEPTLHPQIRDLLETVVEYGAAVVYTNNSRPPEQWLPATHPERMHVYASLHTEGETEINSFLERLLSIREKGGQIGVLLVGHPTRLASFERYYRLFFDHDIPVDIHPFHGFYQNKKYPESYTETEKALFSHYRQLYEKKFVNRGNTCQFPDWLIENSRSFLDISDRNFSGIPCLAGYNLFYIGKNDTLQRCLYDDTPLKKFYTGAEPCRVNRCGCGFKLEDLNYYDTKYWNHYRRNTGWPPMPEPGYHDAEHEYQERIDKYRELKKSQKPGLASLFKLKIALPDFSILVNTIKKNTRNKR